MRTLALVIIGSLFCLTGCDIDLFGLDWKRLGGGYSLVLTEVDNECALIPPPEKGGTLVVEIGWRKPLILARADGRESWDVIDTTNRHQNRISDAQRKTDLLYRDIPIYRAKDAWNRLERYRSLW